MARPRILSVGQCGYDSGNITRFLKSQHNAEVTSIDTSDEALEALRGTRFDLVLVNRISAVDGSSGLDLIRAIKADAKLAEIPVMLVSNYSDAQEEAQKLGALPGFGKGELRDSDCARRLEEALAARAS